jgi:hypothetical protein
MGFENEHTKVPLNGINSLPIFIIIYQAVQKSLVGDKQTVRWFHKPTVIFGNYAKKICKEQIRPLSLHKSFIWNTWTDSGAHLASCKMGTVGPFPRVKLLGGWRWPVTPISCRGQEWAGAITPVTRSACLACSGTVFSFSCRLLWHLMVCVWGWTK